MTDFMIPLYSCKFQSYISNHSEIIQVARDFWRSVYVHVYIPFVVIRTARQIFRAYKRN